MSTRERVIGPEGLPGRDGIGLGLPCDRDLALHGHAHLPGRDGGGSFWYQSEEARRGGKEAGVLKNSPLVLS